MQRPLLPFKEKTYDLAVIGGGINGAAIAHLAALRGLSVALAEKSDFAAGTSSKSSKLMHGGIRYLENLEISLVREALKERSFHLKACPHLVRPLPFIIPVYREDRRPLWMMRAGTWLYDFIAGSASIRRRKSLTGEEALELEPGLRKEGLKGAVLYHDAQMDDARLCLENILSARALGADVANYTRVTGLLKKAGKVTGIEVAAEGKSPEAVKIRARRVVSCAGPWTDELLKMDDPAARPLLRATKGIHLVTSKRLSTHALLIPSSRDRRIFFVLPWKGGSMIGTTDTDFAGNPDEVRADEKDVDYLLEETSRVFPSARLSRRDAEITFAGLRPLLRHSGQTSRLSREHEILETRSGLWVVAGGKYTTYRVIAEDSLSRIGAGPALGSITSFYGSGPRPEAGKEASSLGTSAETLGLLWDLYGTRYKDVLSLAARDKTLAAKICPSLPYIKAQLVYSEKVEMARNADDIIFRRLSLGFSPRELRLCERDMRRQIAQLCFQAEA